MGSYVVSPQIRAVLNDSDRLKVLTDLALIDSAEETVFDRLTSFASRVIGAPISLMSMVGNEYQFFKSAYGMDEVRSTPLSHAFCKHVVADSAPLIVEDARVHPVLHDNGSIKDLNIIGYLGFPLKLADGKTLGSFCVVDVQPHTWSETDIAIMRELAEMVKLEIELRALVHSGSMDSMQLDATHQAIIAFVNGIAEDEPKENLAGLIRAERVRLFGE